ncbi:hypothetical protein LAZ67_3000406, partial [Cordylochernes scorpioides]
MDEKNETQDAEEYTAEGENNPAVSSPKIEPPPPSAELPAVLTRLAACLSALQTTSDRVTHRTEIEVQSFDGTYPAAQFFRTYDQKTDWDGLTNTEKVLRLPRYLNNKPLEHFRRLRMETQHYIQVRQTFLDLYPETNEATYAQYFSMKLAGQPNLEEYYRNKTALGLQLGLPQEVILETLTEGLPPSDQRLVRIVPPENLGAWFRLVQRIRGSGAPSPRHPDEHAPPLLGPYAPVRPSPRTVPTRSTPPTDCRFCGGLHWHSECRLRQAPQLPRASGDARAARSAQLAEQRPRAQPHHQASRAQATGITKGAPDQQPTGAHIGNARRTYARPTLFFRLPPTIPNMRIFRTTRPQPRDSPNHRTMSNQRTFFRANCSYYRVKVPEQPPNANLSHPTKVQTDHLHHTPKHPHSTHHSMYHTHHPLSPEHLPGIPIDNQPQPPYPPQFPALLRQYQHVFSRNKFAVPCLKVPPVRIATNSDKVVTIRPYRVPICDQGEIRSQIRQMLDNDIIEPSYSPFSSPVTLVTKRDKTKRFCIDYRKVNEVISSDVHPLPRIEDILDRLARAKYFSTADVSSAYWQVPIHPDSRPLLAFATIDGLYQPTRLPFGLKTSPQIYERAINQVLQGHGLDCVAHYFDDFVIYSETLEEHQEHLRRFFAFCDAENLQLNLTKCEFFRQTIEFLGYTITAGTTTPLIRNTDVIHAIPPPNNRKTLQSFLGAVNVYNKFIPDYARLRTPLNNLLKKDVTWDWDDKCQKAFTSLKESLTQHPVLHLYKDELPCQVYCDASTLGIAGVLKQVHSAGKAYPVQYFSRALRVHERNYTISELECLAIVESVEKFRVYLMGRKFTIFSDHHALQWLKTIKNPSGRLFRWSLRLSCYEYEVRYIKGSLQHEADLLSRNPFCGFLDATIIKNHQLTPSGESKLTVDRNGLQTLKRRGVTKIVVPDTLVPDLLTKVHSRYNHPGISQMTRLISTQYYWKGMSEDISKTTKACAICQSTKPPRGPTFGELGQLPVATQPFDLVALDTIAGLAKYGNAKAYLHVVVDHFSRYTWTFPSKSTSITTYQQVIKRVLQDGSPKRLLTDRAPAFTSPKFRKFLINRNIHPLLTTSNNPQANGLCERLNATLTGKLRLLHLENPKAAWTKLAKRVTVVYNNTPHSVTGFPPGYLMFGVLPPELTEHVNPYPVLTTARRIAHERTQAKHLKDKHAYDQQHKTPHFEPGDLVLVKVYHHPNTGKLAPYFTGPYEILEIISPNVVRINRPNQPLNRNTDTVHVNKLQYYNENIRYIAPPTLIPHPAKPQSRTLPPLFEHLTPDLFTVERFAPTIGNCTTTTPVDPQCNIIAQRDIPQPAISRPTHITKVKTPIPTVRADPKPIPLQARMVETRSGKMQDPAQERIKAEESAKPQPGATIGRDASSDPVVLNPNIDIPKYDGTGDPRPWIESLEEIGFLYHWADYIISRYAAMNMIGSAKTWLNLHKVSFTSWENFKSRLIEDFASDANKEEMRMRLNRIQQWNEPAIRFAEDILVLCNKVDPQMEEETKINWVIGGLKKEYSFALHLNPPKNTNELLEICKKLDLFEKNYQERAEKSKALYNGPRSPRPHHQEQWKNATSFRRPYQNTSKPQAPAPRYYQNTSKPQAPTPRYYQNKPLPQVSAPRRSYTPNPEPKPVYPSKIYNKNPNSNRNRTEDGRPICFKCNKPGHVARYCRVRFVRIVEEDPIVTQDKVEEEIRMDNGTQKSRSLLYSDLDPKYKMNINVDRIGICEALIDTGADLSVVDLSTALNTGLEIINPDKMCSGPDGKELDIVGNIILNIKFDDKTITHQFVIMRTHLRIFILGRDFLKKMNAKIDCQREIIKYDLTENRDVIKYQQKKIKSAKDAIIPELSIKLINAFVEAEDGEYIIEENHKMFQTNGLRLARSLINVVNKETYIWITNPYPRPLKILKNQTLCFGSQPAEVNLMEESEQKEHEEPQFQINENLAYTEKEQLKQVLERYEDLFSSGLGRSNLAKHRIDTEGAKPIKHKPYRVSAKEREIIKEQIDEMLRDGIIRPSSSPWSFPVILVKKRDGKYRFCVDYRKLNDVTVKDVYPIPRIDEVLDTLQGSKYFSAIDLKSGYWQVEVEEKDKEKTAFTTAHGLYEFNVMPFGLCNAPATFERNMENMLGNLRWQICLCYLDDVIIYSSDFSTHLKRIEAVLKCFREANLKLNNKKCQFAFEELEILGHITNQHGIKPAEHNIKAIRDFPRPKKIKEVQSFLGMCSYYRKFIKGFSKIADPLTSLIKKNVPFAWTENQEKAFQTLKVALINPPILGHFDPNAITYIHTDASNIGLGATLVQKFGDKEKVISYLSRTLSKPEQNYSTTEKECLAVVWSMSKLRPYLYGRHFKIVTDHHALCWLKNLKDPTGRLARWALKIQEYNFEIIHKSGKKHLDADGLSRGPLPENEWDEDYERLFLNQIIDEKDDFIENIKENLSGNKRSITQNFKEENGCLYKKNPNPEGRAWLLVVPKKRRKEVMSEYHNHMLNGHLGVARTTYRLKNKYYWPSMLKDVSEFVKTCHLCQSRKGSNHLPSGLLQPIPPANYPFERIGIDFVGPLPSTKRRRKWIIVLTDYYTKYAETKAVSEATVKEVSTFLIEHIILRHGAPRFLISDRGSQFTSNLMKEVMKMCKVKHCFTTSYHPQTNGLTERLNRTLINMISMYVNTDQKNWDEILPFITHAYNTTIQETTGYSPFFLLFGREPMSLLDDENIPTDSNMDDYDEYIENYLDKIARTRQVVINNTEKTQERMKRNYDKKHNEKIYEPGHLVAVWTPVRKIGKCEKLLRKYFGPYRILKKLSNVNYLIEPKDNPGQDPLIVHVSRLKPYFERIDEVTHEDIQLLKTEDKEKKKQINNRGVVYYSLINILCIPNDPSVSRKMAFESLNQDNVTRSNETFTEPSGGHNQTTTTPDNSKSHHDVIGPPSNYREARRFNTPVYWGTAYRGGLQDSVFQHGGPRRQDSVFGGPRRQDSVFGGPRRQDSVFQHGGPRRQDTTDKFQDGGLDVVQRYLHQVRPDGDYRDEVMASYLECSGLLDSANRCLERLACQFSDPTAPLPTLEKDVAS